MIVLDSSALVDWLLKVLSALRRRVVRDELDPGRALVALTDLADSRLMHHPARRLSDRIWLLRSTHSAYDAAYVALAEALALPLVTTDVRLARSDGHAAEILHAGAE